MKYNPDIHHRHSIRLKGYDYSLSGMYFVTLCTQDRARLFGEVGADLVSARTNGQMAAKMILNSAGEMIEKSFFKTIATFPFLLPGKYVIMPNHFHCIIHIDRSDRAETGKADTDRADTDRAETDRADTDRAETDRADTDRADTDRAETDRADTDGADTRSAPTVTVSAFIQAFKSRTTVEYINGVKSKKFSPFNKRIWQRNYYEHIIRCEEEYQKIWQYIDENPLRWTDDEYYNNSK